MKKLLLLLLAVVVLNWYRRQSDSVPTITGYTSRPRVLPPFGVFVPSGPKTEDPTEAAKYAWTVAEAHHEWKRYQEKGLLSFYQATGTEDTEVDVNEKLDLVIEQLKERFGGDLYQVFGLSGETDQPV